MRQALLELSLTSNGRVMSYGGRSSGGEHGNSQPMLGLDDAPQYALARAWDRAQTDAQRAQAYDWAVEILADIRRGPGIVRIRAESRAELAARVIEFGVGLTAKEVAHTAKCTATLVREIRRAHDVDEEWGRPNRNGRHMSAGERRVLVVELHTERGMSSRKIARHLKVSLSTVQRDLGWST